MDEFTGRTMPGRRWGDGLHQAVEAKEGVAIQNETVTLASISYQSFFLSYEKLAGMTGEWTERTRTTAATVGVGGRLGVAAVDVVRFLQFEDATVHAATPGANRVICVCRFVAEGNIVEG